MTSNLRVASLNARVRRPKRRIFIRVVRLKAGVGRLKARIRRLKAQVEAIKNLELKYKQTS